MQFDDNTIDCAEFLVGVNQTPGVLGNKSSFFGFVAIAMKSDCELDDTVFGEQIVMFRGALPDGGQTRFEPQDEQHNKP